ncbi:diguanylate cyclase [Marinobacterium lacunae]|uniref:Diguanylate cyclase n=1 Tax=Marinobacterium lacunae TaxID=1232683 RepID=A0A081FZU1_9GAMM|nr:bifunctional diguanylate cyclase/phosphodiesterase [Marinobacterium lacunae]KEA64046.1 diguanylate cyclase [Marinobacterium lacunae]MBR9884982.1 bifunctional diguanylate cyclase/phosphodiesterase [Oceanospirillales bacterium]
MPRYRSPRFLLLVIAVGVFAVSTMVSYQRHIESSQLISVTQKGSGWAASELEIELIKFTRILELVGLGRESTDELLLRFDLLWSRVEILSLGSESKELREVSGAEELLTALRSTLREIEPQVVSLEQGDLKVAESLIHRLNQYESQVRTFNVDSFNGPIAQGRIKRVFELNWLVSVSLIGLALSGALLIVMLIRESARNRHQSLHDDLTSLPNRKFVNQKLVTAANRARKQGTLLGIHLIDLNNFKDVNDTLGHNHGDQMLRTIADRLRQFMGHQQTVARMGGDEFLIIQELVQDPKECMELSRRLWQQLGQEIRLKGNAIFPSASLGVSVFPIDGDDVAQVLINADLAMYRAKREGGAGYRRFEPEMNETLQRMNIIARDLKTAIAGDQLVLNYQPVVAFESGKIVSVEALLRWHHPSYGAISPLEVVAVAEQYGMALEFNEWVIRQACLQYVRWAQQGFETVCVAVNISPSMYAQHDLCGSLMRLLDDTGMPAQQLIIEVTEDTTMRDIESSPDTLFNIKKLGVQIALDDFGTGYSSLNHLKRLPVDKLKIDRSFISDLNITPKDPRIIRSIIGLAESLDLQVIAEGIENLQNVDDLRREGCVFGQGYLFSKPVDSKQLTEMLQAQKRGERLFRREGVYPPVHDENPK